MITTDEQVRRLMENLKKGKTLTASAARAGMCENTARKWAKSGKLPSECAHERTWRTRTDPLEDVWDEVREMLEDNPGLEAKTIFEYLQRENPGKLADGQLRTLQRRIKQWRATEGPPKEVYFPQVHYPGVLSESDFTYMNELEITIAGIPFDHILYHFVLTYSNWETVTICYSESFQSLSVGLQNALWELGGTPERHRTDRLTTAVHNDLANLGDFTQNYESLLSHYSLKGEKIQTGEPNENGDIEQAHFRLKKAISQALMLRGSRDFDSRTEYRAFLGKILGQLNAGRRSRFEEELPVLRPLPAKRQDSAEKKKVRVGPGSAIRVKNNTYSVESRLIGEAVETRTYMDHIEVWYAQKKVDSFPRIRGTSKYRIDYRHVIDSLLRKPGAFANYRYREEMFPSSTFRIAYDRMKDVHGSKTDKEYLKVLYLAASISESKVEGALILLIDLDEPITAEQVEKLISLDIEYDRSADVLIDAVDLSSYDRVLLGCD